MLQSAATAGHEMPTVRLNPISGGLGQLDQPGHDTATPRACGLGYDALTGQCEGDKYRPLGSSVVERNLRLADAVPSAANMINRQVDRWCVAWKAPGSVAACRSLRFSGSSCHAWVIAPSVQQHQGCGTCAAQEKYGMLLVEGLLCVWGRVT